MSMCRGSCSNMYVSCRGGGGWSYVKSGDIVITACVNFVVRVSCGTITLSTHRRCRQQYQIN